MRKRKLPIRKPYEEDVPMGLWPQVRARLRPLQTWEKPADAELVDDRMVEFAITDEDITRPDWTGLYHPLLEPNLLPEFVFLFGGEGPAPEGGVVDFYARYGALRERVVIDGSTLPAWAERLEPTDRERLSVEAELLLCEPLWWLRERALDLRFTYQLYAALKENQLPALRELLGGGVVAGTRLAGMGIVAGAVTRVVIDEDDRPGRKVGSFRPEPDPAPQVIDARSLRALPKDECRSWASMLLASQLNIGETRSKRFWDYYVEMPGLLTPRKQQPLGESAKDTVGLVRTRSCEDLLAAMYLQLGELVQRDVVLHHCLGCNRLFYRQHGKQEYCSVSCGDAARQRSYYQQAKALAKSRRSAAKQRRR